MDGWTDIIVQVPAIGVLGFIFYKIASLLISTLSSAIDRVTDALLKQAEQLHEVKDAVRANTAVLERLLTRGQ